MASEEAPKRPPEQAEVYTMTDLEQVKIIADPLRVRLLEAFTREPKTTKQVAELLGEKPTRLYHHVEALERVGLIRLADTRQVRGTVEKYFVAVARLFRADPKVFESAQKEGQGEALADMVSTVLENTANEVRQVIRAGYDLASCEDGIFSYVEVQTTRAKIDELQEKIMGFLRELEETCTNEPPPEDSTRYRLTLAYYPLEPKEK